MTNSEQNERDLLNQLLVQLEEQSNSLEELRQEQQQFNEKFSNYQQAIQWVVQLSFTLIASATITVIITAVFKK